MNYQSIRVYRDVSGYEAERRVERAYAAARRFEKVARKSEARLRYGRKPWYEKAASFFGRVQRVLDSARRTRAIKAEDWALLGLATRIADEMTMNYSVRRAGFTSGVISREEVRLLEAKFEDEEFRAFIRLAAAAYDEAEAARLEGLRSGGDGGVLPIDFD